MGGIAFSVDGQLSVKLFQYVAASNSVGFQGQLHSSRNMNIAEKFGRWFVVGVWILAGGFCLLNVFHSVSLEHALGVKVFDSQDAIYLLAGLAFMAAAFLIARHHRWGRSLSLGLWLLFGYWDLEALGTFADVRWFPITAFVFFVAALFWLLSSASREDSQQVALHT